MPDMTLTYDTEYMILATDNDIIPDINITLTSYILATDHILNIGRYHNS